MAESLDDFKRLHGSLDIYQGVLMHPGVERQEDIFEVDGEFPEIPLAIVSHLPEDYEKEKIPVFSYEHTDKMWSFLNQE